MDRDTIDDPAADVGRAVAALDRMTAAQLRGRYADVFGEPTRSGNRAWLARRVAWRLQARADGGLTDRARRRAAALADDADLRVTPPRAPPSVRLGAARAVIEVGIKVREVAELEDEFRALEKRLAELEGQQSGGGLPTW